MAKTYTLAEMARLLADADRLPDDSEERGLLLRQVQNLNSKGMITPSGVKDDRGTTIFETIEVYKARIFTLLYRAGHDVKLFREVSRAMTDHDSFDPAPSQSISGGYRSEGGLRDSIRGIAAGERWFLTLRLQAPIRDTFKPEVAIFHHEGDESASNAVLVEMGLATLLYQGSIPLNAAFDRLPPLSENDS